MAQCWLAVSHSFKAVLHQIYIMTELAVLYCYCNWKDITVYCIVRLTVSYPCTYFLSKVEVWSFCATNASKWNFKNSYCFQTCFQNAPPACHWSKLADAKYPSLPTQLSGTCDHAFGKRTPVGMLKQRNVLMAT